MATELDYWKLIDYNAHDTFTYKTRGKASCFLCESPPDTLCPFWLDLSKKKLVSEFLCTIWRKDLDSYPPEYFQRLKKLYETGYAVFVREEDTPKTSCNPFGDSERVSYYSQTLPFSVSDPGNTDRLLVLLTKEQFVDFRKAWGWKTLQEYQAHLENFRKAQSVYQEQLQREKKERENAIRHLESLN